jgi:hypothetical protein
LRTLARVDEEIPLEVAAPVTQRAVLDALEARYPMLRGTIRDHGAQKRRPFIRFFACEQDLSRMNRRMPFTGPSPPDTTASLIVGIAAVNGGPAIGANGIRENRGVSPAAQRASRG